MRILFVSTIKQLFRDKEAIFWSLVFPMLFIVIFSFFKFGDSIDTRILLINKVNNEQSQDLVRQIQIISGAGFYNSSSSIDEARELLAKSEEMEFEYYKDGEKNNTKDKGRVNVVMVINPKSSNPEELSIEIFYNEAEETQASPSGLLTSTIFNLSNQSLLAKKQIINPLEIKRTGISVNEIKYFDLLVPGIIGMSIMQSGIIGIASTIASYKEKKILKRLSATPLPIWQFIIAQVVTHIVVSTVQVTIMIIMAKFVLGANIYGSIPLVYFLCFMGNFVFLSLGFIAAAFSKTARAAESLSQVFSMPMMFLSGVFFQRDTLPQVVKTFSNFLPLSPLLDALREVSLQEASIWDIRSEIFIILIWTIVTFIIAARVFRFREE